MSSNNNIRNGGQAKPSKPPPAAPRSMLANLLSSQQRSAAQSRKHLVQRVMPFANLHKDGSLGNAAIKSFSSKEGPGHPSSQTQKAVRVKPKEVVVKSTGSCTGNNAINGLTKSSHSKSPPREGKDAPVTNRLNSSSLDPLEAEESAGHFAKDNSINRHKSLNSPSLEPLKTKDMKASHINISPRKRVSFTAAGEESLDVRVINSHQASTSTCTAQTNGATQLKSALKKRCSETAKSVDVTHLKTDECKRDQNSLKRKRHHEENNRQICSEKDECPRENNNHVHAGEDSSQNPQKRKQVRDSHPNSLKRRRDNKEKEAQNSYERDEGARENHKDSVRNSFKRQRDHPVEEKEKVLSDSDSRVETTQDSVVSTKTISEAVETTTDEHETVADKNHDKSNGLVKGDSVANSSEQKEDFVAREKQIISDDSKTNSTTLADIISQTKPKAEPNHSVKSEATKDEGGAETLKVEAPDTPHLKKRKKGFSPFRIKVGCVVAVRFKKLADGGNSDIKPVIKVGDTFQPLPYSSEETNATKPTGEPSKTIDESNSASEEGKDVQNSSSMEPNNEDNDQKPAQHTPRKMKQRKPKLFEVWTAPIPGQDFGISLLGRRIRCFFPTSYLAKWQKNHDNAKDGSIKRIVEGTVVSILDNECGYGTAVGLLVDRSLLKLRPYLQTIPDYDDDSKPSSSEQKRRNLEALIRGKDQVVVSISLGSVYGSRSGSDESGTVAQWVVAKHVQAKPSGLQPRSSQSLYVGNENDTPTQQEENWRWSACRLGHLNYDDADSDNISSIAWSQLFGEVVKMTVSAESQNSSTSLATVTIRRLLAPHQTKSGKMPHQMELELFDIDSNGDTGDISYFQAPVEQVVVIGKRVSRRLSVDGAPPSNDFTITHSYDSYRDVFTPLSYSKENDGECDDQSMLNACHNCRKLSSSTTRQFCHGDDCKNSWCLHCIQLISASKSFEEEDWIGPCCSNKQRLHKRFMKDDNSLNNFDETSASNSILSGLAASARSLESLNFVLPDDVGLGINIKPSYVPHSKPSRPKKQKLPGEDKRKQRPRKKSVSSLEHHDIPITSSEDYDVFEPSCCRTISFEKVKKMQCYTSDDYASLIAASSSLRQNAKARKVIVKKVEEKSNVTDRAARASQRRIMKSLSSLGDSTTAIDRLAGRDREEQLRFGRSQIHGWGVFATEPINTGDMIIEYRGELIGNAVADKREVEYERDNICDYQFRIDEHLVCDATKLGNVARYINASCQPNCETKIITANENKRIVIYAKKNIQPGEELCYDYKFPIEYNPEKRIPCNCKSPNCQGFMNWDKRYVLIDNPPIVQDK